MSNLSLLESVARKLLTNPSENGLSSFHHMAIRAHCVVKFFGTEQECILFMENKIPLLSMRYIPHQATRGTLGSYILLDVDGQDIQIGCDYSQDILDEYRDVKSLYNVSEKDDIKVVAGRMVMEMIHGIYGLENMHTVLSQIVDKDGFIYMDNSVIETKSYKFIYKN